MKDDENLNIDKNKNLNEILEDYIKMSSFDERNKNNNDIDLINEDIISNRNLIFNLINDEEILENQLKDRKSQLYERKNSDSDILSENKKSLITKKEYLNVENNEENKIPILKELEGFLTKKRKYLKLLSWRICYCKLKNNILKYYYSNQLKGIFDFNNIKYELNTIDHKGILIINAIGIDRKFYFKTNNLEDFENWKLNIQYSIKEGNKNHKSFCKLVYKNKFWKYKIITDNKFKEICDIGDLLLFNTKNFKNYLTRKKNNCDFDHLAIILRNKHNEIVLIQCNKKSKIIFTKWEDFFKKIYNSYNKIGYRKLKIIKNEEYYNKCELFFKNIMINPPNNSNVLAYEFYKNFDLLSYTISKKNIKTQDFISLKKKKILIKYDFLEKEKLINYF